jgi:hypothetical protein
MSKISQFLFVEFAEGQPVEILRVGEFIDARGKPVVITPEDLDAFVASFEAGERGQELPIDVVHERREAVGWLKSLSVVGETLVGVPDWNKLGRELVGEKIYRYLSATVDLAKRMIWSVSLVNFPAVKGLQPIELAEGVYGLAPDGRRMVAISAYLQARIHQLFTDVADNLAAAGVVTTEERIEWSGAIGDALEALAGGLGEAGERLVPAPEFWLSEGGDLSISDVAVSLDEQQIEQEVNMTTEAELQELRDQIRSEMEAEMAQEAQTVADLREQVQVEVQAELTEKFERRQGLVEFAQSICGSEGVALSAKVDDVVAFLDGLDDDQVEAAKVLLKAKVVDLGEIGSSREGAETKKQLPALLGDSLDLWIESGQSIEEFFKLNQVELGEQGGYDLSQFSEQEADNG